MSANELTRRTFAKLLGGALASCGGVVKAAGRCCEIRYACVASRSEEKGGLHLFSIKNDLWNQVDLISTQAPAALASLPGGRGLVVANAVSEFDHRPLGYVESYALDREAGRLSIVSRRALTLSATAPESLAISDCGGHVAVLAGGGSVLNVMPLSDSGVIGYPLLVRKQITSPAPREQAHLRGHLAFDTDGHLLWSDGHARRVTKYTLNGELLSTDAWQASRALQSDRPQIDRQTGFAYVLDRRTGNIVCINRTHGSTEQSAMAHVPKASAFVLL